MVIYYLFLSLLCLCAILLFSSLIYFGNRRAALLAEIEMMNEDLESEDLKKYVFSKSRQKVLKRILLNEFKNPKTYSLFSKKYFVEKNLGNLSYKSRVEEYGRLTKNFYLFVSVIFGILLSSLSVLYFFYNKSFIDFISKMSS